MTGNKYIEIESTYRNRTQYPLPAQFIVNLNQSGAKSKQSALDPVCDSTPLLVFNGIFDTTSAVNNYITGTISSGVGVPTTGLSNTSSTNEILLSLNNCVQIEDFYNGSVLLITNSSGSLERKRIVRYRPVSTTRAFVTLESAVSIAVTNGNAVSIANPSELRYIYVPTGSTFNNYYNNYYLENQTTSEYRLIVSYDGITKLAKLQSPLTTWSVSDIITIRKTFGILSGAVPAGATLTSTSIVTSTNPININASTMDEYYKGDFIRFYSTTTTKNEIRRIIAYEYDNNTNKWTLSFTPSLPLPPSVGDLYEILQFTRDNAVPFNYTGSKTGSQEMVCYDIQLINVIIPNKNLSVGNCKRLPFYTHLYVEFANETAPGSGQTGLIYSNNPNAVKMLFRATIDDIAQPCNSNFLKFNGDNMVQTIKFKPNDNLRFSVRLHTGEILQSIETETYSPSPPNHDIQISAIFSINRV